MPPQLRARSTIASQLRAMVSIHELSLGGSASRLQVVGLTINSVALVALGNFLCSVLIASMKEILLFVGMVDTHSCYSCTELLARSDRHPT